MLGMVEYNVESVKFIGRRDINMDANIKSLFDDSPEYKLEQFFEIPFGMEDNRIYRPYFNDAKKLFRIDLGSF